MHERAYSQDREIPRGIAASMALHIAAGFALILLPAPLRREPLSERSMAVEILSPRQFEAETRPVQHNAEPSASLSQPTENQAQPASKPPDAAPGAQSGAMIRATQLLSSKVLADPRSKQAREALRHLTTDERVEQLCNLEALEQIHTWNAEFQPDVLIAYAMADTKMSDLAMQADGGAFRSKSRWYNIRFKCEVSPDLTTVASLEFRVGDEIPRSEWERHDLTVDDGPAD